MSAILSALGLLLAAAAEPPSPVLARLDCATRMIPADVRLQIRRRYEIEAADEPILEPVPDALWDRIRAQCLAGAPPELAEQVVDGLVARETMAAAEAVLSTRHEVDGEALDSAWTSLPAERRAALSPSDGLEEKPGATQVLFGLAQAVKPESASPELAAAAADQGDPEFLRLIDDLSYYAFARALLEDRGLMPARGPEPQIRVENDLVTFEYGWPDSVSRVPALRAILEQQASEERGHVTGLAQDEKSRRVRAGTEFPGFEWYRVWDELGETPRLLSIASEHYGQTGGAHGYIEFAGIVWDKSAGRRVEPGALFENADRAFAALTPEFCAQLRRLQAAKRGEDAANAPADPAGCGVPLAEQLVMPEDADGDGRFDRWRILVDPYVAGPWVEGTYEVEVPVQPAHLALVRPEFRREFEAW